MSAQSLVLLKAVGSFVRVDVELTPDSTLGDPYPTSAGTVDFTGRTTAEQNILASSNHPTTPQQLASTTTVAFLYSDWTM